MQTFFPLTIRSWWKQGSVTAVKPRARERLELARREISKQVIRRETKISCVTGLIWVTSDFERKDFVLRQGESISLSKGAVVVIEALEMSRIELERI